MEIINKGEDGYYVTFATWSDFPKLKKLVNELSEEAKQFYDPWMFKEKGSIKIRIGQIIARFSLIPIIGKLLKIIFLDILQIMLQVN